MIIVKIDHRGRSDEQNNVFLFPKSVMFSVEILGSCQSKIPYLFFLNSCLAISFLPKIRVVCIIIFLEITCCSLFLIGSFSVFPHIDYSFSPYGVVIIHNSTVPSTDFVRRRKRGKTLLLLLSLPFFSPLSCAPSPP